MNWQDLKMEVINRRRAGQSMREIAEAVDEDERRCASIWGNYCRKLGGAERALGLPSGKSAADVLAEWRQNARAVIEGERL